MRRFYESRILQFQTSSRPAPNTNTVYHNSLLGDAKLGNPLSLETLPNSLLRLDIAKKNVTKLSLIPGDADHPRSSRLNNAHGTSEEMLTSNLPRLQMIRKGSKHKSVYSSSSRPSQKLSFDP